MAARGTPAILLATHNPDKRREMARIVAAAALDLELLSLDDFPGIEVAPEHGATFAEIARAKALWYAGRTGRLCLADDSGLEVDALGGAPGVRSARFAGSGATDAENRARLLSELAGAGPTRRTARFRCAVALAGAGEVHFEADGVTEGVILAAERGRAGFGYDPLFHSAELGRTFAEVDSDAKDRVSHRGRALARVIEYLRSAPATT